MLTTLASIPLVTRPPHSLDAVKSQIHAALDSYGLITPYYLHRICGNDVTTEERLAAALEVLGERTNRVDMLEQTIDRTALMISDWAEAWGIDDTAIDDLNARFNATDD